ncbi:tubulin alpha-2 chain [Galendromus occidentalis]|uniref:Tubulin alpha chain n=1 Tax=Galendromus occidentalis TaxID=34638 RepID=A0AAJ7SES2_9ACAR|nr:tubulin alpha-2 chain [Galendromus occidentalis]
MREIVNVNIGQAGVKIGEALWKLLCLEHGVSCDGTWSQETTCGAYDNPECVFYGANGKFFPRAVFVDSEPDAIDALRKSPNGASRRIFNPSFLISGSESAANNFAWGRYRTGPDILESTLHEIRRMVERCDSFQGFIFSRSISGGTGSGFAALLLEHLYSEYQQKSRLEFALFPSPNISSIPVEPYNAVLSTQSTLPTIDCTFVLDNEAVYNLLRANLRRGAEVDDESVNLLIAQAISSTTLALRASCGQNMDIGDFSTNLVPSRKLHFPGLSFAPVVGPGKVLTCVKTMTRELLESKADLVSWDPRDGRCIACCLLYRGPSQPVDVQQSITKIKGLKQTTTASWCPPAFKVGHVPAPPIYPEQSVFGEISDALSMLSANTAVKGIFKRMTRKFDLLFSKRAFVHSYLCEGMSINDIRDAFEDVEDLIFEYQKQEEDMSDESFSSNTDGI